MDVKLNVQRYDPEKKTNSAYQQEYELDVPDEYTVLDTLIKVREDIDPTLALRCSCRASVCGSCAMRVNGQATLACKTKLKDVIKNDEASVGPAGNMPVIKDLIVDMKPFWNKLRQVEPYLQPDDEDPVTNERLASNESMVHLTGVMNCIMCGACVSDCTAMEVNPDFIGPAALAKAYRFVGDPRDGESKERLKELSKENGIWDCTRCFYCVEVCPKEVAPMEWIMELRDKAMEAGFTNNYGARHTLAFVGSVKNTGHLNETLLPIKTWGFFNLPKLIAFLPVAVRAILRGKTPPLIHKKIKGYKKIKRVYERLESEK